MPRFAGRRGHKVARGLSALKELIDCTEAVPVAPLLGRGSGTVLAAEGGPMETKRFCSLIGSQVRK